MFVFSFEPWEMARIERIDPLEKKSAGG